MKIGTITVNPDSPEKYLVEVEENEILQIGRKPAPDGKRKLVLPFPEVSGQHAEIRCKPNGWTLVDSGSTNGTMVNGLRLTPGREYALQNGDRIQIAQYDLVVAPHQSNQLPDEPKEAQDKTQFRINLINATILVADIKGFTRLSEDYANKPGDVMQAAQTVFEVMNQQIGKNFGNLEKIAGDAIMAYWTGDDGGVNMQAYQACKTALELRAIAEHMAEDKSVWPFEEHPLKVDMALATGPVAAGALGHANTNTALLGDTANLVFRLEKLIGDEDAGAIIVEAATYKLASTHFAFKPLGNFNVKGRQRAVEVYRLLGAL
ncbi:MAG TPA: adenylate/guanylate cyclase domain-containing protein [Oculatellaceae cyanobacterium]